MQMTDQPSVPLLFLETRIVVKRSRVKRGQTGRHAANF